MAYFSFSLYFSFFADFFLKCLKFNAFFQFVLNAKTHDFDEFLRCQFQGHPAFSGSP